MTASAVLDALATIVVDPELLEVLSTSEIRRLPSDQLATERAYSVRERALTRNEHYRNYQTSRIAAITREQKRREILRETPRPGLSVDYIRGLKARVDIRDIMNWLGILVIPNGTRREKYGCPCHADKHPSGVVYVDDQEAHCFQCGFHGDVFDIVMAVRGVTFLEAVRTVAAHYGEDLPTPGAR